MAQEEGFGAGETSFDGDFKNKVVQVKDLAKLLGGDDHDEEN